MKGSPHEEKTEEKRKTSEKREVGFVQTDWSGPGASLRQRPFFCAQAEYC
jgi:hypothetical protein